jgi:putative ABC transport system substrate-binding protein
MLRRRDLIALLGVAAAWPTVTRAQPSSRPVIGFLSSESPARFASRLVPFRQGLKQTGYVEGENVTIEYRWAEGHNDRLPALAADLVARQVNVIAAPGTTPAALAVRDATTTIPAVFYTAGDPIALKFVKSLSSPGGNMTGATSLGGELAPKRLGLMRELLPSTRAMALLVNPTNPKLAESATRETQDAARQLGLELHIMRAESERDFESVFAELNKLQVGALVIAIDSFFTARRQELAALALRHRLPAIYQYRDFAEAGGVMSYGGSLTEPYQMVGVYTGRILKGEKPAELPVQQVTKVELVVNAKAAKTLGLEVPPALLVRADEVIE